MANSRVLMSDWSTKPISRVKIGESVMGYDRVGNSYNSILIPTCVTDLTSDLVQGATGPVNTFRFLFEDGTRIVCDRKQKFWVDRIRNGKVWKTPSRPGMDVDYTRAMLLREDHYIRGIGNCFVSPPESDEWNLAYECVLADRNVFALVTPEISRGYLAGIFDTIGTIGLGTLTIKPSSPWVASNIRDSLGVLGYEVSENDRGTLKIESDSMGQLKFLFNLGLRGLDKKQQIASRCFKGCRLKIVSITAGTSTGVYSLVTDTQNFIVEGLVCKSDSINLRREEFSDPEQENEPLVMPKLIKTTAVATRS